MTNKTNQHYGITRIKRFFTGFLINVFVITTFGIYYPTIVHADDTGNLDFLRCVLRNRPMEEDKTELVKNFQEDTNHQIYDDRDSICLGSSSSIDKAITSYKKLSKLYEEIYGKPEEFLATEQLISMELTDAGEITDTEQAGKIIEENEELSNEFYFKEASGSAIVTTEHSLRYIYEYFMNSSLDKADRLDVFASKAFAEDEEALMYDKIKTKIQALKDPLYDFIDEFSFKKIKGDDSSSLKKYIDEVFESDHIEEKENNTADRLKQIEIWMLDTLDDDEATKLNQLGVMVNISNKNKLDEEIYKAGVNLGKSSTRLVMDILFTIEMLLSKDLGELEEIQDDTKLLPREFYTLIKGKRLDNSSGLLPFIHNRHGANLEQHNGDDIAANLEDYFTNIKGKSFSIKSAKLNNDQFQESTFQTEINYPQDKDGKPVNVLKEAGKYFEYLSEAQKAEALLPNNEYLERTQIYDGLNRTIKFTDPGLKSEICHFDYANDISAQITDNLDYLENGKPPTQAYNNWEFFVSGDEGHYYFNFSEAYRSILDNCYDIELSKSDYIAFDWNKEKDYIKYNDFSEDDGATSLKISGYEAMPDGIYKTYIVGVEHNVILNESGDMDKIITREKSKKLGGSDIDLPGIETPYNLDDNQRKDIRSRKNAKIQALHLALGMKTSFERYNSGYSSFWNFISTFTGNEIDQVGYEWIRKTVELERDIVTSMLGYFVSDYMLLHGAGFSSFDPTEAIDYNDYEAKGLGTDILDTVWFIGGFFQTMICDVTDDSSSFWGFGVLCTNRTLYRMKGELEDKSNALYEFINDRKAELSSLVTKINNFSYEDLLNVQSMREYETNIIQLMARVTQLQVAVNGLYQEILEVSAWVDTVRAFYMWSQLILDAVGMMATLGAWGMTKIPLKMANAIRNVITSLSKYKLVRGIKNAFHFLHEPIATIQLMRFRSGTKLPSEATQKALEGWNKVKNNLKALENTTVTKRWYHYKKWMKFKKGFGEKSAEKAYKRLSAYQKNIEMHDLKKVLKPKSVGDEGGELGQTINNYYKNGKTELKDLESGSSLTGDAAKNKVAEYESILEETNNSAYKNIKKNIEKVDEKADEALLMAKEAENWEENILRGRLTQDMTDGVYSIDNVSKSTIENSIKNISKELKVPQSLENDLTTLIKRENITKEEMENAIKTLLNNNEEFKTMNNGIKDFGDIINDKGVHNSITTDMMNEKEAFDSFEKLIKNYDELNIVDKRMHISNIQKSSYKPISNYTDDFIKYNDAIILNKKNMALRKDRNFLRGNLEDVIDRNLDNRILKNYSPGNTHTMESLTDGEISQTIEAIKKARDKASDVDLPVMNKLIDDLDEFSRLRKEVNLMNETLKNNGIVTKVKNVGKKVSESFSYVRKYVNLKSVMLVSKTAYDITRIVEMMMGYHKDCQGWMVTEKLNQFDENESFDNQAVVDALKNIYGSDEDKEPAWAKKIQQTTEATSEINIKTVPKIYYNFLLLKYLGIKLREQQQSGIDVSRYYNTFQVMKANLLISMKNLSKQLAKISIPILNCGGEEYGPTGSIDPDCNPKMAGTSLSKTLFANSFFSPSYMQADLLEDCWEVMSLGTINIGSINAFAGGKAILGTGEQIIARIIKIFLFFAGGLAVLAIIYGGLLYTYSNGEEEVLTKAKNIWFHAILGLLATMLSYFIVQVIEGIFYSF